MSKKGKVKIEVFYSKTCPHCGSQKELAKSLENENVKVKLTDTGRKRRRAKRYGVRSVPTTLVSGPGVKGNMGFRGTMSRKRLENAVKVARGEMEVDDFRSENIVEKVKKIFS